MLYRVLTAINLAHDQIQVALIQSIYSEIKMCVREKSTDLDRLSPWKKATFSYQAHSRPGKLPPIFAFFMMHAPFCIHFSLMNPIMWITQANKSFATHTRKTTRNKKPLSITSRQNPDQHLNNLVSFKLLAELEDLGIFCLRVLIAISSLVHFSDLHKRPINNHLILD